MRNGIFIHPFNNYLLRTYYVPSTTDMLVTEQGASYLFVLTPDPTSLCSLLWKLSPTGYVFLAAHLQVGHCWVLPSPSGALGGGLEGEGREKLGELLLCLSPPSPFLRWHLQQRRELHNTTFSFCPWYLSLPNPWVALQ